jgi:diaminopimelate decarboxylase
MDRRFWDLEIGSQDHLTLGGCDLVELAHTYGTPLHVVDETRLRRNVEDFRRAFAGRSPGAEIFYSYKTNCVPGVLSLLHEQGCGAEAASPYECWLAAALGVPPSSVIYNGISRSIDDFERAILGGAGLGLINVDSIGEAERLAVAADRAKTAVTAGLRIDPGVGWKAHFGVQARPSELRRVVDALRRSSWVTLRAVHAHIGSCITETDAYARAIDRIAGAIVDLQAGTPIAIDTLDIGGGFGVPTVKRFSVRDAALYRLFNRPPAPPTPGACASIDQFAETIVAAARDGFTRRGLKPPRLLLEPGRALTGSAQTLLVTVKDIKSPLGGARFAMVDAGMQNVAFPLSYEYHQCFVANRASAPATDRAFVAGPLCSAEDLLYRNWPLPALESGDVLAIMDAGAYFTSFANNFSYPRPPVVLASQGRSRLLQTRQTFEDLAALDRIGRPALHSDRFQPTSHKEFP